MEPLSTRRLAKLAGVSHVTVARVLRNDPCVAAPTAKRVRTLIDAYGYRPNPMVSALMVQLRTSRPPRFRPTIAYLNAWWPPSAWWRCPTKTSQFAGAKSRAGELGYKLEMFWLCAQGMTPERMAQIFRTRHIQGILIGPVQYSWKPLSFAWDDFSLATISFSLRRPELHNAGSAVFNGMGRIMVEIQARGYRRVGYITSRDFERRVGTLAGGAFRLYQQEFEAANRIEPLVFENSPGVRAIEQWLRRTKPDVIVTRLQDVYEIIQNLGIRMPMDLGFAHLDLSPSLKRAGVAGFDQLDETVGACAVELVINQIHNNVRGVPKVPTTQFVYGEFIAGTSLRAPKAKYGKARFDDLNLSSRVYVDRNSFD